LPDALSVLEPLLHAHAEDLKRFVPLARNLVPPDAGPDASGPEFLYGLIALCHTITSSSIRAYLIDPN
jgi:hypothetical protein